MRDHTLADRQAAAGARAHRAHRAAAEPARHRAAARARLPRVSHVAVEYLLALPIGAAMALVWANTSPESYYRFAYSAAFFVNDLAMVCFFAVMTKEVVEATAPGGVLHSWRRVALALIAAAGATLFPALLYIGFVTQVLALPMLQGGWLIPAAVDVALVYVAARLLFGRHPAVSFVLLVALAANALAFAGLGLFYPGGARDLAVGALTMTVALAAAGMFRRGRVASPWPYVLVAGTLSWLALYWAGFHPALALLPIVPFLPHGARDPGFFVDASPTARDALSRLEMVFRYPAQAALFFFGLVNAGVMLGPMESGMWAIPVAVVFAKPLGLLAAVGVGRLAGLHLPARMSWRELIVVGLLSGMGFTMALFLVSATMAPGQILTLTKTGVLIALATGPAAWLAARLLRVGRYEQGS